jgi:hypothetical protein
MCLRACVVKCEFMKNQGGSTSIVFNRAGSEIEASRQNVDDFTIALVDLNQVRWRPAIIIRAGQSFTDRQVS